MGGDRPCAAARRRGGFTVRRPRSCPPPLHTEEERSGSVLPALKAEPSCGTERTGGGASKSMCFSAVNPELSFRRTDYLPVSFLRGGSEGMDVALLMDNLPVCTAEMG